MVTKGGDGYTSYECKYQNAPVGNRTIAEGEAQTLGLEIGFYRLGFVSKAGFASDVDAQRYVLLSLEDLYR